MKLICQCTLRACAYVHVHIYILICPIIFYRSTHAALYRAQHSVSTVDRSTCTCVVSSLFLVPSPFLLPPSSFLLPLPMRSIVMSSSICHALLFSFLSSAPSSAYSSSSSSYSSYSSSSSSSSSSASCLAVGRKASSFL